MEEKVVKKKEKQLPLVVIFGRTNVGKSTLFNTFTEKKLALVSDIPGTTRDSNSSTVEWQGREFELVDTGGIMDYPSKELFKKQKGKLEIKSVEDINLLVQRQALNFFKLADLVLFVVDNKSGLLPQDKVISDLLKKHLEEDQKDKILLTVNKVDNFKQFSEAAVFNKLGLGEPLPVSAATGSGTGDLLDEIVKNLRKKKLIKKTKKVEEDRDKNISVCIVGKPNVGKSSLINKLFGSEKVIVSDIPHTTREPQNVELTYKEKNITFIDTAGISRKGKKGKKGIRLEKFGIEQSLRTMNKADIVLLVLEINKPITHQDAKIIEEVIKRRKSLVIVANKWDLIEERDTKEFKRLTYAKLPFASWAPIQFISAKSGEKVQKIFDLIVELDANRRIELSDSVLTKFLNKIVKIHKPAKAKGTKRPRIYELTQLRTNPPRFIMRIGSKDTLDNSYVRFVKNRLRDQFGFTGLPLDIFVLKNAAIHGQSEELAEKRKLKQQDLEQLMLEQKESAEVPGEDADEEKIELKEIEKVKEVKKVKEEKKENIRKKSKKQLIKEEKTKASQKKKADRDKKKSRRQKKTTRKKRITKTIRI